MMNKHNSNLVLIGKTYATVTPEPYKNAIINFLYSTIKLDNYKFSFLSSIETLLFLQQNEHYVSYNRKGYNYFLIFITLYGKPLVVMIDRKKLTYQKSNLQHNDVIIYTLNVTADENLYKGTIFDGKLIKVNNSYEFVICDCLYLMETFYTKMDMLRKIQHIQPIINQIPIQSYFDISTISLNYYSDIPKLVVDNNDGLVFYPKVSGNIIIFTQKFLHKKHEDAIQINNISENLFLNKIFNSLKSKTYPYEKVSSAIKCLVKTDIPDVYEIYEVDKVTRIGIAHIPSIKLSHMCKNIITESDKFYTFKCTYSLTFRKWIPLHQ